MLILWTHAGLAWRRAAHTAPQRPPKQASDNTVPGHLHLRMWFGPLDEVEARAARIANSVASPPLSHSMTRSLAGPAAAINCPIRIWASLGNPSCQPRVTCDVSAD